MKRCERRGFERRGFGIYLFIGLVLVVTSGNSHAAMVHGTVYDCFTLEPLTDVILVVNSTPQQQYIAKSAVYSFNLHPGDYCITARYYLGNELEYYSQENITIEDEGDFILDVIMFPALDINESLFEEIPDIDLDVDDVDVNGNLSDGGTTREGEGDEDMSIMIFAILLFVILLILYYLRSKFRSKSKAESKENAKEGVKTEGVQYELYELPGDLRRILTIVRENGGRMTQRELRGKLHHSEAKISLMLSDLENRGLIRKFKKGRGNIIVLVGLK